MVISPILMSASVRPMDWKGVPATATSVASNTTGTLRLSTGTVSLTAKVVVLRRTRSVASALMAPPLAEPVSLPSKA